MKRIIILWGMMVGFARQYVMAQTTEQRFPKNTTIAFTGTVANQPVLAALTFTSEGLNGQYKYLKTGGIIPLEGIVDWRKSNKFELKEGEQRGGIPRPTWNIFYQNDSIIGKWKSSDQKKIYNIRLGIKMTEGTLINFHRINKDTLVYDQPGDTTAPGFNYANSLLYPAEGKEKYLWLIDSFRRKKRIDPQLSIGAYAAQDMKKQVAEYKKNVSEAQHPEYESWNWDYENEESVSYNDHDYLTIRTSGYEFMGGAHGSAWEIYDNYDLKSRREVRLPDILTINSTEISTLLEKAFRKEYEVKQDETLKDYGLFENTLLPSNNFYFDDWGLYFIYNQYEIGPYVLGISQLFIPWGILKPYLEPAFVERMKLKYKG